MSGNAWPPWPKNSPELLAHYVNVEATRKALPAHAFAATDAAGNVVTLHDLRAAGRIADVVRVIYDAFARCGITYDLEPVLLNEAGGYSQAIRPPADVVGGKGTCVDLALVFAAACIDAHLLPQILILRNSARGVLHALVVVDAVNTDDRWADARGWTGENVERGMLAGTSAARLWQKPDGELWKRVADERYLLIECTGFAATAIGRATPTLSFDEARGAAASNLSQMDHIATLDLVRLRKGKGYAAYDPPDARGGATVYDIVLRNYPDLADFTYDNEVRDLTAAETARFVGRGWLADRLASFRASAASGYFCVVADAGLGKTAIAADIASRERASAFFFSASENRTHLESCLRHLAVDIISRFSLPHDHLPERAGKDWSFLKTVLEEAVPQAGRILLVLDGVDEAFEAAGANTLFMPARLPAGVHVVLTSRVDPVLQVSGATMKCPVRITADDARQKKDVELFLEQEAARPELAAALERHGLDRPALVTQLRDASDGNFMYLRYALDDLARSDGTPGAMELGALPAGLSGYYEQFWAAMKQARGAEDWKEWEGLYLPTITALVAAMEPVTADWLAAIVGRPAREIADRALAQWRRFLRHHKATGRWWIVHKSFEDFLVRKQAVEVDAAHRRIAEHYLGAWGGLAAGLPGLTTTPSDDNEAYGRRQLAAHLRYGGDQQGLQTLVTDARWYSMRLAEDPSGEGFQADLLHGLAAAERRTRDEIQAGGHVGGVVREVDCALALGSITSLSNNLPGELLAELVDSGHWQPTSALQAIRMNPERDERERALGALAPALDEPAISDALNQMRALGSSFSIGLTSILRRLCVLGQGERALAEALRLPETDQAKTLQYMTERLPDAQRGEAISILASRLGAYAATTSGGLATALARLFAHAPASLLPAPGETPPGSDGPLFVIVETVASRWAELGDFDRALGHAATLMPPERTLATAKLLRFIPDIDLRTTHVQTVIGQLETLDASKRAEAATVLLPFVDAESLNSMIRRVLADVVAPHANGASVFKSLAPMLPRDLLDDAAAVAGQLDSYHHEEALTHLAFRAAELGDPEKAMALGRTAKHSYTVESVISRVLARLAKLGHHEIAVSYAERAEALGLGNSLASMLAEVSRHVSGQFLDRLRDRAKQIANTKKRRAALLGIAPRFAELGQPEEALALARLIDDQDEQWGVPTALAVVRARTVGDYDLVLDAIDKLPPLWRWRGLEAMATDMPPGIIRSLIARPVTAGFDGATEESDAYAPHRKALTTLLSRLAAAGHADEAWAFAERQLPEYRYTLLAALAPHLAEPDRTRRLDETMRVLLGVEDSTWWKQYAAWDLVAVLSEASLRRVEAPLLASRYNSRAVDAIIARYATLKLPTDSLRVGGEMRSSGSAWIHVAPHLDAQGVDAALALSDNFWIGRENATGALIARLAALGHTDAAIARIESLSSTEETLGAVAAAAPVAPPGMLDWLEAQASSRQESWASAAAFAALASRYAALGDCGRAMKMLETGWVDASATPQALAAMAPMLEGTLLERGIDVALSLQGDFYDDSSAVALAALLPVLARQSLEAARLAARIAADSTTPVRAAALSGVAAAVIGLPRPDLHVVWSDAIERVATHTRRDVFRELAALMPLVERLGGVAALDGVEAAIERVSQRWP